MNSDRQLALFTDGELTELATPSNRHSQLMQMDGDFLQEWKKKVFRHQQQVRESKLAKQTGVFLAIGQKTTLSLKYLLCKHCA